MKHDLYVISRPPLADPGDIHAQTDQQQMKNDILTLCEKEFKTLETELIPAGPGFSNQGANYYEQRKLNHLITQKDPDSLLARSMLADDRGNLELAPVRQDVTGFARRQREMKYAQRGSTNWRMRKTAQKDVDNLVNNLRRDISLEGDTSLLKDTTEYTDAFYFSQLFGEETIKERTLRLQQMKEHADNYSQEEIAASKAELGKVQDMVLFLKNYGSDYSIRVVRISWEIRAHRVF